MKMIIFEIEDCIYGSKSPLDNIIICCKNIIDPHSGIYPKCEPNSCSLLDVDIQKCEQFLQGVSMLENMILSELDMVLPPLNYRLSVNIVKNAAQKLRDI